MLRRYHYKVRDYLFCRHNPFLLFFAESEGFKPPIPTRSIPDFESGAFDHSANFPFCSLARLSSRDDLYHRGCKISYFIINSIAFARVFYYDICWLLYLTPFLMAFEPT